MRLTKMLCLSALAALAATAFLAVPLAAADETHIVICAKAELECENPLVTEITELEKSEKKEKHPVAQIHGTASEPKLLTFFGTVECEKSLANITVLNELGESLLGHVTELEFTGKCHIGEVQCEEIEATELGDVTFTKIGPLEADAKPDGGTKVHIKCGFLINCTYTGTENTLMKAHSTATGVTKLLANETKLEEGEGFACPEIAFWDAEYPAVATMYIES